MTPSDPSRPVTPSTDELPPPPPDGDLPAALRWQAAGCGRRSPLYRGLLTSAAADAAAGGPISTLLVGYADQPMATVPGLRLMGAVHHLVLSGALPELAPFFPSVGGSAPPEGAWPVLRQVLAEQPTLIGSLLDAPVQTNETGRAAVLFAGLLVLAHRTGLPVRLLEIGASAGLNLRADRFGYRVTLPGTSGPVVLGDRDSPLVLDDSWVGTPSVPLRTPVRVVERRGCDPAPIDPTDPAGRLRLESLVWADEAERLARLRGALAVAERVPARVDRATDTAGWLADRLAESMPGVLTLVWHSVVRQYVDHDAWIAVDELLADVGESATGDAPLARLGFEPELDDRGRLRFAARLTCWPDGQSRLLGTADGHGTPFVWSASAG